MTELSTGCHAVPIGRGNPIKSSFLKVFWHLIVRFRQSRHQKPFDRLMRDARLDCFNVPPSFEEVRSQNVATQLELSVLGHSPIRW